MVVVRRGTQKWKTFDEISKIAHFGPLVVICKFFMEFWGVKKLRNGKLCHSGCKTPTTTFYNWQFKVMWQSSYILKTTTCDSCANSLRCKSEIIRKHMKGYIIGLSTVEFCLKSSIGKIRKPFSCFLAHR